MKKIDLSITIGFCQPGELSEAEQQLIESAKDATHNSYSPYSKFAVGAAVRLADGTVITGANQENAAYPSGLCAERTAIFAAQAQHPDSRHRSTQSERSHARPYRAMRFLPSGNDRDRRPIQAANPYLTLRHFWRLCHQFCQGHTATELHR